MAVPQVVAVQGGVVLASAGTALQEATPVGPVLTVLQVVAVQEFPEPADVGVHAALGVGPVVAVLQLVTTQEASVPGVQEDTPVGPVVVVVQLVAV